MIIAFPGTPQKKQEQVQTVYQPDSLIGQVIKIGGRDDTVPMTLRTPDGAFVDVNVKGRDERRKLAQHLFGADIKVNGNATWTRDEEGQWTCSAMEVLSFEETDSTSLVNLFEALRRVPNNHSASVGRSNRRVRSTEGTTDEGADRHECAYQLLDPRIAVEVSARLKGLLEDIDRTNGQLIIPVQVVGEYTSGADQAGQEAAGSSWAIAGSRSRISTMWQRSNAR